MENIADNNLIRFMNISKKKDGLFANFKVKGIRGGTVFSATIAVDLTEVTSVEISIDPLERIVEESAKIALREMKRIDFHFEPLTAL